MRLYFMMFLLLFGACSAEDEKLPLCMGPKTMLHENEVNSTLEITETATEYLFSGTIERSELGHTAQIKSYLLFDLDTNSGDPSIQFPLGEVWFNSLRAGNDPAVGRVNFPSENELPYGLILENEFENTSTPKIWFSAAMAKQGTYHIAFTKWVVNFTPSCSDKLDTWTREQPLNVVLSNP